MITRATENFVTQDGSAVGVFQNHEFAEAAVKELADSHFDIKKISIVGRGFHTDEKISGFYTSGDRIRIWGKNGLFWGGLWGLFMGGLFLTAPTIGPVIVLGHLASIVASTIEGAAVVGGISAFGAAMYSFGIPKESVLRYERAIKADGFLIVVHGDAGEIKRAQTILQNQHATESNLYEGTNAKTLVANHTGTGA